MIVKSADPTIHDWASLKKMLNEIEALLVNGYKLKSITECNGNICILAKWGWVKRNSKNNSRRIIQLIS